MPESLETDVSPFNSLNFSDADVANDAILDEIFSGKVTAKPDEVKKIEEEVEEEKPKKKVAEKPKKSLEEIEREKEEALSKVLNEEEEEEEEEEETPKVKKKIEEKEKIEEESNDNTFSLLSKELFGLGVFSQEEGEEIEKIDTPEKFLQRFTHETEKKSNEKIEAFLGRFGDDYKAAFEAIYVNSVDPKEYFTAYNEIVDLSSLDLKVEENQVSVIRQDYQERGLTPDQIKAKIEKIRNYGDLEEEAAISHTILLKNQSTKLAKIEEVKKAQLQQEVAIKQQFVSNVTKTLEEKLKTKEFDGIPLNPKLAQEVNDYLVTEKWTIKSTGEKLTDFDRFILDLKKPENHNLKVKIALLAKTLEKDPTLQTIQKSAVSKETNKLFNTLTNKKEKTSVKEQKSQFTSYL